MSFTRRKVYTGLRGELGKYLLYGGDTLDFSLDKSYPRLEFDKIIRSFEQEIDSIGKTKEKRLRAIDAILSILKKDLMYSCISDKIYNNNLPLDDVLNIPMRFKDKEGNERELYSHDGEIEIDLVRKCTLVKPQVMNKYLNNVINEFTPDQEFKYERNHNVHFFPTLDIAIVKNGYHSITNGLFYHKKVLVKAKKINDVPLIESVYSDGAYWYNYYDDKKTGETNSKNTQIKGIENFLSLKFAILFKVTQWRYELEKE